MNVVRYLALAACGYVLLYFGLNFLSYSRSVALPIMAALMAFGTLAARHARAPEATMGAAVLSGFVVGLSLVRGGMSSGQTVLAGLCLAATAVMLVAGRRLYVERRGQAPTEPTEG